MDAFEQLVSMLLERDGYWVRPSFKVELTPDEKRMIGRSSSPRWELDLVAYKGGANELLMVECKSFLDSRGVTIRAFGEMATTGPDRYKLFNSELLREVVSKRLVTQLVDAGSCAPSPVVTLCLAAGRIASDEDRERLREHFNRRGWRLFDDRWLRESLARVASAGYENDIAIVATKILIRSR